MNIVASDRIGQLTTGIFLELAQRKQRAVASGQAVIDLSVGSPDLAPPEMVMETLARESRQGTSYGYTLRGLPSFHQAVTDFYSRRYNVELDAEREVLQLMGSQEGLAHLAMAVINPGDYVLIPDPGYPIYEASVRIAGGELYQMPLREEHNFLPKLDEIPESVRTKTKMMIISYPGNPVTALCDTAFFEEVVAFAKRYQILVVHDFAYSELVFDGVRPVSFLNVPGAKEVGIEFNSLSKTYNMAGCRIGYVVGNAQAIGLLALLKSHIDYGVFHAIQKAAEAALLSDDNGLREQVKIYEARRDALTAGLAANGWFVNKTPATMFMWAKIPAGWTSREFAFSLLEQQGVAVTPGDAFGREGEGYVRIALVQPVEKLTEAAHRIGKFL